MDSSTATNDHDRQPRRRLARRWMPSRSYPKPWLVALTDRTRKDIYLPHPLTVRRPR